MHMQYYVHVNLLVLLVIFFYRELAFQIADQFRVFGKQIGIKDAVIVGGLGKSTYTCVYMSMYCVALPCCLFNLTLS